MIKKVNIEINFNEPDGVTLTQAELDLLTKLTITFFQLGLEQIVAPKLPKLKGDPNPNAM